MRRRRTPNERAPGGRLWLAALGGFVAVCGLVLILAGELPSAGEVSRAGRPRLPARVLQGLRAAQQAQRALDDKNYGEAREYLGKTQDALSSALADLEGIDKQGD